MKLCDPQQDHIHIYLLTWLGETPRQVRPYGLTEYLSLHTYRNLLVNSRGLDSSRPWMIAAGCYANTVIVAAAINR